MMALPLGCCLLPLVLLRFCFLPLFLLLPALCCRGAEANDMPARVGNLRLVPLLLPPKLCPAPLVPFFLIPDPFLPPLRSISGTKANLFKDLIFIFVAFFVLFFYFIYFGFLF